MNRSFSDAVALAVGILLIFGCTARTSPAQLSGSWELIEAEGSPQARGQTDFVEVDGKMYLVGGNAQLDVYDPATNSWTTGASIPEPFHHLQAVAFDGKIYVIGAWLGGYPRQDGITHVLIYDPAEDVWTTGPEIPEHRRRGSAGAVAYGDHIYVVGGNVGGHGPHARAVPWVDRFNPRTGEWAELPDAPHRRDHFRAVVVNGRIYATAGRTSDIEGYIDSTVAVVDVFDIATQSWSTLDEPIPTQRAGTSSAVVGNHVVVIGGEGRGWRGYAETEALNTETGTWELIGMKNQGRHGAGMVYYDGRLWVAGGSGGDAGGGSLVHLEVFAFED